MHVIDQLDIAAALLNIAPSEHALLRTDHDFGRQTRNLTEQPCVIDEAWNIARHEPVHHAAHADDLAGKDARIDRAFRIVPHDAPQKLHVGGRFAKAVFHVDRSVRIFQVAIASPGP